MSFMQPRTLRSAVLARMTSSSPGLKVVGGRFSRRSSRSIRRVTRCRVARRSDARTSASKMENSVAEWGEKQAFAPIEPQQVRIPVLRVRGGHRFNRRRQADDGEKLSSAPQDHSVIVRSAGHAFGGGLSRPFSAAGPGERLPERRAATGESSYTYGYDGW